ncbi:MAG: hypothetical protein M3Y57_11165 [Acidobacteriota bacterium]|nr:hypothetical protein [Acidobacteriota bacterium]
MSEPRKLIRKLIRKQINVFGAAKMQDIKDYLNSKILGAIEKTFQRFKIVNFRRLLDKMPPSRRPNSPYS